MGRWQGNLGNPVPNAVQQPIEKSEKLVIDNEQVSSFNTTDVGNRAKEVRRDTDSQKNFTISLYDIDETILTHLEQLQIQVEDQGKQVKVPIFYGSPERWVSAQRDGYMRDKQGKIILPAIILKRANSGNDESLKFFNRYLDTPVMKLYSEKNAYTQFSRLTGQNSPVNEVYNVLLPKHMVLTYHFIVWTAYVEQMNRLIETIAFNTQDYWGSKKGFRFRTQVDSGYNHTVEIQASDERIVKSEFDLITHGYILPDQATYLEKHKMTTQKVLTPKKFVVGMEVVSTGYDWDKKSGNREKWRNPNYPNLQRDVPIQPPGITVDTNIIDSSGYGGIQVEGLPLFLRVAHVPTQQDASGQDGDISYDQQYFYVFYKGTWRRAAIADFLPACSDNIPLTGAPGQTVTTNSQYFYIYSGGGWKRAPITSVSLSTPGTDGDVMFDTQYFYIYNNGSWRRMALESF